ncbi:hypothetical protein FGL95_20265 [Nocardiaceae bacterium YC2-7]|uniref:Uncharacterized protein n=1 Tax=Antrihabitans stalactiti TaxID=2584121 RepID=A0A848KK42_9NOCA|nr:hypothetical protein [Antrihabitans stalactiti]
MLPIDPTADFSRRAWVPCPNCDHGAECGHCQSGRNCDRHWQYLLSNQGRLVHLQCRDCAHLWQFTTRPARGVRPSAAETTECSQPSDRVRQRFS